MDCRPDWDYLRKIRDVRKGGTQAQINETAALKLDFI